LSELPDAVDVLADLLRARHLLARAVELFAQAGHRYLADGRPGRAADLLGRACRLLELDDFPATEAVRYAELLDALLTALIQAGRLTHAQHLAERVDELDCAGLPAATMAGLRTRLAWAATDAGQHAPAAAQLATARSLLPPPEQLADIDAIAARLALRAPGADPGALGARALDAAADRPETRCQALDVLGRQARRTGASLRRERFRELLEVARRHQLGYWSLVAQWQLGIDEWLAEGATQRLAQVARTAAHRECAAIGCAATTLLALDAVLRGCYPAAEGLIRRCQADADALGLGGTLDSLAMIQTVLNGHQGNRERLRMSIAGFRQRGAADAHLAPLAFALGGAFCALLEEDRATALADLDRVGGRDPLTGQPGIRLLLRALAGRSVVRPTLVPTRWDRSFALFARAVQLGRSGHAERAAEVTGAALRAAAPYPLARQLGLRLIAEAAHRDGWGQPGDWLTEAEEYFHRTGVPAVAAAARSLLRQWGSPLPQRRDGAEDIPAAVRRQGVTVRECDVLRLLIARPGNRAIAARLHISPRTVEKHMASLLMKLGQPNREALRDQAVDLFGSMLDQSAS
jgi:DNA-binding CsgD family transcriptional regulator